MSKRKISDDVDLNCIVCTDVLCEPVSLKCGHTICYECVQRLKKTECPVCRQGFSSTGLKKNLILSKILEDLYKDEYTVRSKKRECIRFYYGSERFDLLCDLVTDIVDRGKDIGEAPLDNGDPNTFFVTMEDIIESVLASDITKNKYLDTEVKACVYQQLNDKIIIQSGDLYMLNGTDWILEKIINMEKKLSNDDLLCMLTPIVKSYDYDLGKILKNRKRKHTSQHIELTELNDEICNQINSKKIEF